MNVLWFACSYGAATKNKHIWEFLPISPHFLPFLPGRKVFLPMVGEKYISAEKKASPALSI